jgi:hypothetical protein
VLLLQRKGHCLGSAAVDAMLVVQGFWQGPGIALPALWLQRLGKNEVCLLQLPDSSQDLFGIHSSDRCPAYEMGSPFCVFKRGQNDWKSVAEVDGGEDGRSLTVIKRWLDLPGLGIP